MVTLLISSPTKKLILELIYHEYKQEKITIRELEIDLTKYMDGVPKFEWFKLTPTIDITIAGHINLLIHYTTYGMGTPPPGILLYESIPPSLIQKTHSFPVFSSTPIQQKSDRVVLFYTFGENRMSNLKFYLKKLIKWFRQSISANPSFNNFQEIAEKKNSNLVRCLAVCLVLLSE
jgi:hypothetical protein